MKRPGVFLTCFGLFWTAIVLVFDGLLGYSAVNQIRARSFSSTTGVITHSEVTSHSDSDGSTSGVDIRYHYEVGGQTFEGNRYRYGAGSSSDSGWANGAVTRYHVGAEVPVFYDPKNPSESVLSPGLDGSNYMFFLFLTPFNMVMLGFWGAAAVFVFRLFFKTDNGGVRVIRDSTFTRVRLPRYQPLIAGLATTGLVGFLEIFPIAFAGGGFHPRLPLVRAALFIAYSSGAAMFLWQWWRVRSGASDLIIDKQAQMIQLPRTFGRKENVSVPLSRIRSVSVATITNTGSEGGTSYTYAPTLNFRDPGLPTGKLAEWLTLTKANQFATWLNQEIGVSTEEEKEPQWQGTMPVKRP